MNDSTIDLSSIRSRAVLVAGLLTGALGIALLWAGGVDFPVAVPPGLVILAVAAILVATIRNRWTAALGCLVGLFVFVGFLLSGTGFDIIGGSQGALPVVGQLVEVLGVAVAAVSGALLAARRDRAA